MRHSPPFLLTMADYYGTLAAVRCLGRAGLPVTVAEGKVLAPARWSRYVTRRVSCPGVADTDAFLGWLLEFGRMEPGHVLYPTSDDMAFLFALNKDALSRSFRLFQPDIGTLYGILNKERLQRSCELAGIDVPVTYFPGTPEAVRSLESTARYPLLIKPRTQILFETHVKGAQVAYAGELTLKYDEFVRNNRYGAKILAYDPNVVRPMLQAFHPEAARNIYSVSGFCDPSEDVFVARAAVKVLQHPRKLGIGLCFEHAEVDPAIQARLIALFKAIGYFGVFEVEFVRAGDRLLLIDFNPRFYSQMNFEVTRGLPLPVIVYFAALGEKDRVRELVERARQFSPPPDAAYCHRFIFEVLLRAQSLSGKLNTDDVRYWRDWLVQREPLVTDAVLDDADRLPAFVDVMTHLRRYARHPRAFLRSMVLDQ